MLISSVKLENGTVITPFFSFYMELGLPCSLNTVLIPSIYCFDQYAPRKCYIKFFQSVVDARRGWDENPLSVAVAETMKLLGNSSYGYKIMDRSRHTITKYLNDKKTRKAINEPLFKNLNHLKKTCMRWSCWNQPLNIENPTLLTFSYFSMHSWECWNSTIIFLTNFKK